MAALAVETNYAYPLNDGKTIFTNRRRHPNVTPPASQIPTDAEVFPDGNIPDTDFLRQHFFEEGRLSTPQILKLLESARAFLTSEPTLLELEQPINICGDVHGQYYDLLRLFEVGGDPSLHRYLFLGDYVDRGYFSVECLLYLCALKLRHGKTLFMLRGNHECRHLTKHFTFHKECLRKYNADVFEAAVKVFNALPLAAVVDKKFFCVHGGISPEMNGLEEVRKLNRIREPPTNGLMCDLLWSDPAADFGEERTPEFFAHNRQRGCSFAYTYNGVMAFLKRTGLQCVIRAHEAQDNGYRLYKKTPAGFPSVITMFSAPNYLDVYKNKGAILAYDGTAFNLRQFAHVPHPYWLPDFMDAFTWSVPFVGEKVAEMILAVLDFSNEMDKLETAVSVEEEEEEEEESEEEEIEEEKEMAKEGIEAKSEAERQAVMEEERQVVKEEVQAVQELTAEQLEEHGPLSPEASRVLRHDAIRAKAISIGKVARLLRLLREERETINEFKRISGIERLPPGTLASGAEDMRKTIETFRDAKTVDRPNEHLPPELETESPGYSLDSSPSYTAVTVEEGEDEMEKLLISEESEIESEILVDEDEVAEASADVPVLHELGLAI